MRVSQVITDWYLGNSNNKEKEVPRAGFRRFCYLIWNHFGKLLGINLLFLLCCIPIVTIPPALCGLNRYLIKMYHQGYGFEIADFFHEFKTQLLKSIPIGLPFGALLFYGYYLLRMSYAFQEREQVFFIQTIAIVCMMLAVLFGNYCFVLLASLNLKGKDIIKDAFILMICEWKASFFVLVVGVFAVVGMLLLFPYSILVPLLGGFSVTQLAMCSVIFPVVEKRIIKPYEIGIGIQVEES